MNMRERIARAIEDGMETAISNMHQNPDEGPYPNDYLETADAVLDVLREPDEGMVEAGFKAPQRGMNLGEATTATWQAMIDYARTPPEGGG